MLDVTDLNQYYGESHILRDVQLGIVEGSCTCLMGRNGVGKTTLLKSIMGLLRLRSGKIRFAGTSIEDRAPEYRARMGIGYVPQGREDLRISTWKRTCPSESRPPRDPRRPVSSVFTRFFRRYERCSSAVGAISRVASSSKSRSGAR